MCTSIRPTISENNKYWIDKHRYYELKHFCLQYQSWKRIYAALEELDISSPAFDRIGSKASGPGDPTTKLAMAKLYYSDRIKMVERTAKDADEHIGEYILRAVTEELSYTYLKSRLEIPCSRDMYYDRYRRFFWLLSKERE